MTIHKTLIRLSALVALAPQMVLAAGPMTIPMGSTDIEQFFLQFCIITNWVFAFVLVAAIIAIIFSGVGFLTSGGDTSKVTTARQYLMYALIGVVIVILAKAFIAVVGTLVGVPGITAFLCN